MNEEDRIELYKQYTEHFTHAILSGEGAVKGWRAAEF